MRNEKTRGLVFIRAIPEYGSLVQQPLSYQLWPRSFIATCVSSAFSGLLMKAVKHSTIKSGSYQAFHVEPILSETSF